MTQTKFNRYYQCAHCGKTHVKRRANQKFCSTRCRSGHWAMNQPKKKKNNEMALNPITGAKTFGSDVLKSSIGTGMALVSQHLIQLAEGNSNKDIVRNQQDLAKNQMLIGQRLDFIIKELTKLKSKNYMPKNTNNFDSSMNSL